MTQQEFELFLEAKYPQLFGTDIALGVLVPTRSDTSI